MDLFPRVFYKYANADKQKQIALLYILAGIASKDEIDWSLLKDTCKWLIESFKLWTDRENMLTRSDLLPPLLESLNRMTLCYESEYQITWGIEWGLVPAMIGTLKVPCLLMQQQHI